jgi:hypothetical protein
MRMRSKFFTYTSTVPKKTGNENGTGTIEKVLGAVQRTGNRISISLYTRKCWYDEAFHF